MLVYSPYTYTCWYIPHIDSLLTPCWKQSLDTGGPAPPRKIAMNTCSHHSGVHHFQPRLEKSVVRNKLNRGNKDNGLKGCRGFYWLFSFEKATADYRAARGSTPQVSQTDIDGDLKHYFAYFEFTRSVVLCGAGNGVILRENGVKEGGCRLSHFPCAGHTGLRVAGDQRLH